MTDTSFYDWGKNYYGFGMLGWCRCSWDRIRWRHWRSFCTCSLLVYFDSFLSGSTGRLKHTKALFGHNNWGKTYTTYSHVHVHVLAYVYRYVTVTRKLLTPSQNNICVSNARLDSTCILNTWHQASTFVLGMLRERNYKLYNLLQSCPHIHVHDYDLSET